MYSIERITKFKNGGRNGGKEIEQFFEDTLLFSAAWENGRDFLDA
jgi:hypothetical protein